MKKLFILISLSFCLNAYADQPTDKFVIEKPDGTVAIVHYLQGSGRSLENILEEQGLSNFPIYQISDSELNKLDRKDRKYWKKKGNKIVVDTDMKLEDLNAETAKEEAKEAVLKKLKISKEEAEILGDIK